jgi:hypothetical protein
MGVCVYVTFAVYQTIKIRALNCEQFDVTVKKRLKKEAMDLRVNTVAACRVTDRRTV